MGAQTESSWPPKQKDCYIENIYDVSQSTKPLSPPILKWNVLGDRHRCNAGSSGGETQERLFQLAQSQSQSAS